MVFSDVLWWLGGFSDVLWCLGGFSAVLWCFFLLLMALALPPLVFQLFGRWFGIDVNIMAGARSSGIE
jgi:hypothetical protein